MKKLLLLTIFLFTLQAYADINFDTDPFAEESPRTKSRSIKKKPVRPAQQP